MGKTKQVWILMVAMAVALCIAPNVQAVCLQDQYGNQYDFTVDVAHTYLFGVVRSGQGCTAPVWHLTGSYIPLATDFEQGVQYELTGANPLGDGDIICVPTYKIKGTLYDGAWYYTDGYGNQEFTFSFCDAAVPVNESSEVGGALRK